MKKGLLIVGVALVCGLAVYLSATAANSPDQANAGPGFYQSRGSSPLVRFVRENMAAQTIAELSHQDVGVIRKQLEEQRLPAVLAARSVDRKAFADGMRTRFQNLLGQLSNDGYLTADQKNQILAQVEQRVQRRTLMKGLIDKAITDGTITQDQAETLMKRP